MVKLRVVKRRPVISDIYIWDLKKQNGQNIALIPSKHACTVSVLVKYRQYWQYRQQYCRYRMGTDPDVFFQYRNGTVLPVQFLFWFFTESLIPISGT